MESLGEESLILEVIDSAFKQSTSSKDTPWQTFAAAANNPEIQKIKYSVKYHNGFGYHYVRNDSNLNAEITLTFKNQNFNKCTHSVLCLILSLAFFRCDWIDYPESHQGNKRHGAILRKSEGYQLQYCQEGQIQQVS